MMLWIALLLMAVTGHAGDRAVRHLHTGHGLPVPGTVQIVEGADGFLWVSHNAGVSRFDGTQFDTMPPTSPLGSLSEIAPRPAGGVWAVDRSWKIWVVSPDGTWQHPMPPCEDVRDVGTDVDGSLLAVGFDGQLWKWDGQSWETKLQGLLHEGEKIVRVIEGPEVVVMTNSGALSLTPGGPQRELHLTDSGMFTAVAIEPDRWVWAAHGLTVSLIDPRGKIIHQWPTEKRAFAITRRGGAVWVSANDKIGRLERDGSSQWFDVDWAGHLFLDPENALWMTGPRGIYVWPEPDSSFLPVTSAGQHFRFLGLGQGRVWGSTWFNAVSTDDSLVPEMVLPEGLITQGGFCTDSGGTVRTLAHDKVTKQMYVATAAPEASLEPVDVTTHYAQCTKGPDGAIWFGLVRGENALVRVEVDGQIELYPVPDNMGVFSIGADPAGRIWVGHWEQVCWATAAKVRAGAADWQCAQAPFARTIDAFAPVSNDRMWAGTDYRGVIVISPEHGTVANVDVVNDKLRVPNTQGFFPSPRGGIWVVGTGGIIRVDEDGTLYEEMGIWNGVEISSAGSVVEEQDGDVWLGSSGGIMRVPGTARDQARPIPDVRLLSTQINGEQIGVETLIDVPPPPHRVDLLFAATSFRAPEVVRYAMRMHGRDEAPTPATSGRVELVDLPPGPHTIAVVASLDGKNWSEPAVVHLVVAVPWWRQPWVPVVVVVVLGLIGFAGYRTRVAVLLTRERERLRIAMDLHDEIGSGLGSIRILSSLIGKDNLTEDSRRDLASQVEHTAGELHGSLQGLVGTLRPKGTRVDALVDAIRHKCSVLFADEDTAVSVNVATRVEDIDLSLPIRNDVERFAAEALHNAARHAGASTVKVTLKRHGNLLSLTVQDDGVGFDVSTAKAGLGLESMQHRATRMGGHLTLSSTDRGTRITLDFPTR